jgi:uncharacterized protein (TIGR00251 family)
MLSPLPHNPLVQGDNLLLDVKVTPQANESKIVGWKDSYLTIRIAQIASEGKANEAVVALLAKAFSLRKSQVEIVAGHTSRIKRIRLHTCSIDLIRKRP